MGLIRNMFGAPSLESAVRRARTKLASGELESARRIVGETSVHYGDAAPLRELELSIERAQARASIRNLKERIENGEEAHAYEELVRLYLELGMFREARSEAVAYGNAHPDRDSPHLMLGEMCLQAFLDDLQARDAHVAWQRLRRAAALNPLAIKPRLLLAELCFCVGADTALRDIAAELEELTPDGSNLDVLLDQVAMLPRAQGSMSIDGHFERVEADGALLRSPRSWPLEHRRHGPARVDSNRAQKATEAVVARGGAMELVLLQRNGRLLAHAVDEMSADVGSRHEDGLVDIARTVSQTISRYARDLDLGAFKRCTLQGDFGVVAVGELGTVVAGARWNRSPEPQRLWERISVDLEGSLGGGI